jgi:hypothetical protein
VLARRLIAVSPDDAFAAQLSSALVAVDLRVETYRDVASLGVDPLDGVLCVIHVAGEVEAGLPGFVANLAPDCRIIVVLPRASLVALVEIMERSDRIVGMIVAEDFDPSTLAAMANRVRTGDVFGVEKLMAPDTPVQAVLCEYSQRTLCRARVVAYASQHGVPRRLYAAIEQCVDEMLMNALYDAPVDETGKHVFAGVPVRTRVSQKLATNIVVQYACDGTHFAVAVRDGFGSIERDTVLRVLHKCLHAAQKIDKKAGGAGVGLYLMVNASSAVYFNVIPGVATEAICVFELARPKQQLDRFGFFRETIDVTGTLPTERPPAAALRPTEIKRPIGSKLLLAGGILSAALLGLAIWHRQASNDSGVTEPAPPATVELDTKPTGAAVDVNGLAAGETPVTLTTFAPGTSLAITFTRKAFKPASVTLRVPAHGKVLSHVETLVASEDYVTVSFVTTPPGARVLRLDAPSGTTADRTYTPTELSVEVGKVQRFMLVMPGRVPLVIPPFTPERGAAPLQKGGELAAGATLHVEGAKGAKITVTGTPHCALLDVPADCTLAPGDYSVDQIAPDGSKQTKTVKLTGDDSTLTF